jgi:hypothetical protein
MCKTNSDGSIHFRGMPMTRIARLDPGFQVAPGDFFAKLRAGGSYSQPAPGVPPVMPTTGVRTVTSTPLANSFINNTAPYGQPNKSGYEIVG